MVSDNHIRPAFHRIVNHIIGGIQSQIHGSHLFVTPAGQKARVIPVTGKRNRRQFFQDFNQFPAFHLVPPL